MTEKIFKRSVEAYEARCLLYDLLVISGALSPDNVTRINYSGRFPILSADNDRLKNAVNYVLREIVYRKLEPGIDISIEIIAEELANLTCVENDENRQRVLEEKMTLVAKLIVWSAKSLGLYWNSSKLNLTIYDKSCGVLKGEIYKYDGYSRLNDSSIISSSLDKRGRHKAEFYSPLAPDNNLYVEITTLNEPYLVSVPNEKDYNSKFSYIKPFDSTSYYNGVYDYFLDYVDKLRDCIIYCGCREDAENLAYNINLDNNLENSIDKAVAIPVKSDKKGYLKVSTRTKGTYISLSDIENDFNEVDTDEKVSVILNELKKLSELPR